MRCTVMMGLLFSAMLLSCEGEGGAGAGFAGRVGMRSRPMMLRGGGDSDSDSGMEVQETMQVDAVVPEMTRKEMEAQIAAVMAGEMPDFVREKGEFQHVIRILNTNVEGKRTVLYALTKIKGVGRRFCDVMCKKVGINKHKRAGELTPEEIEKVVQVLSNPGDFDIPSWMLNRRKDYKTGKDKHLHTNELDFTLREDLDRLRKARVHRGLRHMWGWKVRGQHTKTTGRGSAAIPGKKKPPK